MKTFFWFITLTVGITQILIPQAHGEQPVPGLPSYTVILPTTYSKDNAFLVLEPIIYKLFKYDQSVINNLHEYDLTVSKVYTRRPGGGTPEGHGDTELLKCRIVNGKPTSSIEGICLDGKTLKTTDDFNPPADQELTLQLDAKIKRDGIEKPFQIFIEIKPECKAKKDMASHIKTNCLPEKHKESRIGGIEMRRQIFSGGVEDATKFEIDAKFHNQFIVLTTVKLLSKTVGASSEVSLSIDAIGLDDKVINLTTRLKVSRQHIYVKMDIFITVKAKAIAIFMERPDGKEYTPMEVEYYGFEDFCKKDTACYQEFTLWETYLDRVNLDQCSDNNGVPDLAKLYGRCIEKSKVQTKASFRAFVSSMPSSQLKEGMGMTIKCNPHGPIYVPHQIQIERVSKYEEIEQISHTSTWLTGSAKFEDMTYYRCSIRSFYTQYDVQQTDWELVNLTNIHKTKMTFRKATTFDSALRNRESQEFGEMENLLNNNIKKMAEQTYQGNQNEFQVINFDKYSLSQLTVYGAYSMMVLSDVIREQSYGDWLKNVQIMLEKQTVGEKIKNVEIKAYGFCMEKTTAVDGMEGSDTYDWQAMSVTDPPQKQSCKRNVEKNITAKCVVNEDGFYAEMKIDDSECVKEESEINLNELAQVNVTKDNVEKVSSRLRNLTRSSDSFTTQDVESGVTSLENIVSYVASSGKVADDFFQSVDDVLAVQSKTMMKSQTSNATSQRLMNVINKAGGEIAQDPPKTITKQNYALGGMKISKTLNKDLIAKASSGSSLHLIMGSDTESGMKSDSSIIVPSEITRAIGEASAEEMNFVAVVYRNNVIFQTDSKDQIMSRNILSAEIRGKSVQNTSQPIKMMFKKSSKNHGGKIDQYKCVFWNVSRQGWSTRGMNSFYHKVNDMYECHSNHLTNFALLFNAGDVSETNSEILSAITYVGLGLNMAGAVLTLLTYIIFPILREHVPPKILMNLCAALIMLSIIFLVGAERDNKTKISCEIASFLLQYTILAVFCWSAIEGFHSVRGLVFPMKTDIRGFITKAIPIGWGLPLLFTGIGFGIWKDEYIGDTRCVVSGRPFYVTVLIPIVFTILFNIVSLVAIMLSLKGSSEKYTTHALTPRQRARIITAFMILFGLTWVFGFLVINNDRVVFQYLFCIISTMQGLYVFIFYGLRNKKVRLFWMALLRGKSPQYIQRANTKQLERKTHKKRANTDDSYSMTTSQNYTLSTAVHNGLKLSQSPPRSENIYTVS